jgi:uncharacterized protein (TIGR00266 family)
MASIAANFSMNQIPLKEGESLVIEPGGMLAHKNCTIKTNFLAGSFWEKLKRYTLGGETLFRNTFTAQKNGGWISLEEHLPGQIVTKTLTPHDSALMIRRTALLASTPNVQFQTKYLGLSGYMKGQGFATNRSFVEKDPGQVYFHAHDGVVRTFRIRPEDGPVIIDNDMVLAYSENLDIHLKKVGSVASSIFSGEGLVCEFKGDGVVYVASGSQTGRETILDIGMRRAANKIGEYTATTIFATGSATIVGGLFYYYTGSNPLRAAMFILRNIILRDQV